MPKKKIASKSLKNFGLAILTNSKKKVLETINIIAPEHLELCTNFNREIIKGVKNAGSIFIGKYSPEAIGDYIAGPNHVLPTSGSARFSSGLSVPIISTGVLVKTSFEKVLTMLQASSAVLIL